MKEANLNLKNEQPKEEMDVCVMCGKETMYPKRMHIDFRFNYIEGVGQLCRECSDNLSKKEEKK